MDNPEERRQHPRLNLGEAFTARFEVEGRVYKGVPMTNVSIGGIGLRMQAEDLAGIVSGTTLRNLVLEHHALPSTRVQAQVRHILGLHAQRTHGSVFLGIQFLDPPEALVRQLEAFIAKRLGE